MISLRDGTGVTHQNAMQNIMHYYSLLQNVAIPFATLYHLEY